jgi:hypothetical protein
MLKTASITCGAVVKESFAARIEFCQPPERASLSLEEPTMNFIETSMYTAERLALQSRVAMKGYERAVSRDARKRDVPIFIPRYPAPSEEAMYLHSFDARQLGRELYVHRCMSSPFAYVAL